MEIMSYNDSIFSLPDVIKAYEAVIALLMMEP